MHNCKKCDLSMNVQIMEFYYRDLTTEIYNNAVLNAVLLKISTVSFQRKQINRQPS